MEKIYELQNDWLSYDGIVIKKETKMPKNEWQMRYFFTDVALNSPWFKEVKPERIKIHTPVLLTNRTIKITFVNVEFNNHEHLGKLQEQIENGLNGCKWKDEDMMEFASFLINIPKIELSLGWQNKAVNCFIKEREKK